MYRVECGTRFIAQRAGHEAHTAGGETPSAVLQYSLQCMRVDLVYCSVYILSTISDAGGNTAHHVS